MVKYYRQYKERAIIDVSSDDLTTYDTKTYDSSFDSSRLYNASRMPLFQNTIDDVGNNIIYYSFDTVPTDRGTLANKTTHINWGNYLLNSDIYTQGGLIQVEGEQNEFQYEWTDTSTVSRDYIKLDVGTFGFRADNNNVDDSGFSVCFWFKCKDNTKKNTAFQAGPVTDNPGWNKAFVSILMPYNGNVYFINSDGASVLALTNGVSTSEIYNDEMAHWVFTRRNIDATHMSLEIYKNGELIASNVVTRYNFNDLGKDIYINHTKNITSGSPLDPDINNSGTAFERFKFFNQPLTGEQVRQVYSKRPRVGSYIVDSISDKVFQVTKAAYIRDNIQDYVTNLPNSQGFGITTVTNDGYEYIEIGDAYWDFVPNTDANENMLVLTTDDNMYRILSVEVTANVFPSHNQGVLYYDNGLISYEYLGNINVWTLSTQYNLNDLLSVNSSVYKVIGAPDTQTVASPNHVQGIAQYGDIYNYLYIDDIADWKAEVIKYKYIVNNNYVYQILKTPINPNVGKVYPTELPPIPVDVSVSNRYTSPTNYITYDLDKNANVTVWEPDNNGDTFLFKCTQGRDHPTVTQTPPDPNITVELSDKFSYEVIYKVTLLEDNIS
eukprot:765264-Hanusia_phi.AAC.1